MTKMTFLEFSEKTENLVLPILLDGKPNRIEKYRHLIHIDKHTFCYLPTDFYTEKDGIGSRTLYLNILSMFETHRKKNRKANWSEGKIRRWEEEIRKSHINPLMIQAQKWKNRLTTALQLPEIYSIGILTHLMTGPSPTLKTIPIELLRIQDLTAEDLLLLEDDVLYRFINSP